ncbi:MAG: formylglycine-generating enzyme family protein [Steroidobacteraceae bacterium]
MAFIPGGTFRMGSDHHYPEEAPAHPVAVDDFWIDRDPVTNAEFERFVRESGYATLAERPLDPAQYPGVALHLLAPASLLFCPPHRPVGVADWRRWWRLVPGASWRHPYGPGSSCRGLEAHPVVHVAYEDALAYARWADKELPTEAQWERAARGGLENAEYAWGDAFTPGGRHMANTWQGRFPHENTLLDGFERTSPTRSFLPNGYGVYDMIGNVWEWTSDYYAAHADAAAGKTCCVPRNPRRSSAVEDSFDPHAPARRIARRVIKGGSHLCAPGYCRRYRPAARQPQAIDSPTSHIGFRCVAHHAPSV